MICSLLLAAQFIFYNTKCYDRRRKVEYKLYENILKYQNSIKVPQAQIKNEVRAIGQKGTFQFIF